MMEAEITPEIIGRNLRRVRKFVGISSSDLAESVGVHRNTIANYESGKTTPPSSVLVRLASELGITVTEIVSPDPVQLPKFLPFKMHGGLK